MMTGGVDVDGIEAWLQTGKPPHPNTWGCERGWTDRFRALRMLAKGLLGDDRKVVAALGISMPSQPERVNVHHWQELPAPYRAEGGGG